VSQINCDSDYYTLEYRESTGPFDAGIPSGAGFWDPHDPALDAADKDPSSFPDGSVILDLHCPEVVATSSGMNDYGAEEAVVPGHLVTFKLGSQSCSAETGINGVASCSLVVHELGHHKLKVHADSTRAYGSASGSRSVDVKLALPHPILKPLPEKIHLHHFTLPKLVIGRGV
jgi:hypothetical protein